jgi:mono/diheme cytochrome c family protein
MTLLSRLRARPFARVHFLATAIAAAVGLASCGGPAQPNVSENPNPSRGEVVFAKYCNSCHPKGGRGSGPSLVQTGISKDEFTRYVRNGKGRMPGFNEGLISNEDLDQMYEYISGLSK